MMGRGMILGEVIGLIVFSRIPVDNELELLDPVADRVKLHVHCSGSALLNSVVGYAYSAFFVCLDVGGSLWMTKFF
jgi:hypothetical protein